MSLPIPTHDQVSQSIINLVARHNLCEPVQEDAIVWGVPEKLYALLPVVASSLPGARFYHLTVSGRTLEDPKDPENEVRISFVFFVRWQGALFSHEGLTSREQLEASIRATSRYVSLVGLEFTEIEVYLGSVDQRDEKVRTWWAQELGACQSKALAQTLSADTLAATGLDETRRI